MEGDAARPQILDRLDRVEGCAEQAIELRRHHHVALTEPSLRLAPDSAVATNWANPGVDNGKWQTAFPVTPRGASSETAVITALSR